MFDWGIYLNGLAAMGIFALMGWVVSVIRRNVTLVDSMWSLFFLIAVLVYAYLAYANLANGSPAFLAQFSGTGMAAADGLAPHSTARAVLIVCLVAIWALRLSIYLTWRNGIFSSVEPHEDHRYQAIRKNNEPHFWLKSLYIVFGLQLLLAWVVSLPLLGAVNAATPLTWLDMLGAALWLFGLLWESIGDWQLTRFKANPANKGKVMSKGLWGYSRHPNYFGECCLWWGCFMIALSAGAWWSVLSPILMTLLLLKVSGVALLEKDIAERRPGYAEYIANTNAFFPWKRN